MTFFERQHLARRNSRLLLLLFFAAVAGTLVAVDLLGSLAWVGWRLYYVLSDGRVRALPPNLTHVPLGVHFTIGAITLGGILGLSAFKAMELRAEGGAGVARMLGGRGIARSTADPLERRLMNVVEEMAIASGTRVPLVFVMDQQRGINAFTAGHDVSHAAIAVTRGALERLTRDELQGVVAHEFSHIVNGDMALSIRMVGVLAGIVWIGAAGEFIMREAAEAKDPRVIPVAVFGLLLYVIGAIGLFFSRLIKATFSRERELLADAGGVQFTRNAEGIAGALDQIRASYSWVSHRHTEDVSHLFFADAHGFLSEPLFATHPPIEERIARIAPGFAAADYRRRRASAVAAALAEATQTLSAHRSDPPDPMDAVPWTLTAAQAAALVGSVQQVHLESARRSLRALSPELRVALDDPPRAAGVVLALLLAQDGHGGATHFAALEAAGFGELLAAARAAAPLLRAIGPDQHLAIVDLALPVLRAQPEAERTRLAAALDAALASDRRVSVYGFAYATFVRSQLAAPRSKPPARYRPLPQLRDDAAVLISLVAHAGCGDPATLERDFVRAFEAGAVESGLLGQVAASRRDDCTPEAASGALQRLQELPPLDKARLVKALFAAITADGVIRPVEAALMRMIGGVLDCPLPPLMASVRSDGPGDAARPSISTTTFA